MARGNWNGRCNDYYVSIYNLIYPESHQESSVKESMPFMPFLSLYLSLTS